MHTMVFGVTVAPISFNCLCTSQPSERISRSFHLISLPRITKSSCIRWAKRTRTVVKAPTSQPWRVLPCGSSSMRCSLQRSIYSNYTCITVLASNIIWCVEIVKQTMYPLLTTIADATSFFGTIIAGRVDSTKTISSIRTSGLLRSYHRGRSHWTYWHSRYR